MKENQIKGWLYLLPALLFLGFFHRLPADRRVRLFL